MKKLLWIFLLTAPASWLGSCTRTSETLNTLPGTYTGTFNYYLDKDQGTAQVKITFTESWFDGKSDSTGYPAICTGTYNTWSDSIRFINSCDFPANTPHSLMLDGKFAYVQKGDSLFIRRVIGDIVYEEDVFRLRRE